MAKRGRKPKGEYAGKTKVFSTRLRPDTKAALVAAAAKNGRSLSQEVEHRLRRSFDEDRDLFERFGGRQNYALLRLIGSCLDMSYNPTKPAATWRDDVYAFDQTLATITSVLGTFRPEGDSDLGDPLSNAAGALQGTQNAVYKILEMKAAKKILAITRDGKIDVLAAIKNDLGELSQRIDEVRFYYGNAEGIRALADKMESAEKPKTKRGRKK